MRLISGLGRRIGSGGGLLLLWIKRLRKGLIRFGGSWGYNCPGDESNHIIKNEDNDSFSFLGKKVECMCMSTREKVKLNSGWNQRLNWQRIISCLGLNSGKSKL